MTTSMKGLPARSACASSLRTFSHPILSLPRAGCGEWTRTTLHRWRLVLHLSAFTISPRGTNLEGNRTLRYPASREMVPMNPTSLFKTQSVPGPHPGGAVWSGLRGRRIYRDFAIILSVAPRSHKDPMEGRSLASTGVSCRLAAATGEVGGATRLIIGTL